MIFISYSKKDMSFANRLYSDLSKLGLKVWIDCFAIRPGSKWKLEIKNAIKNSKYFLALLSSNSLDKRGYFQRELREAINTLDEIPETDIF